ncbi:MAG: hypothetical protein F6K48_08510 [Okeania sp. SIO3H1]|nr:hypothetical protein [Okeania sp. SIO3H1]
MLVPGMLEVQFSNLVTLETIQEFQTTPLTEIPKVPQKNSKKPMLVPGMLEVHFSKLVTLETIQELRTTGLTDQIPQEIANLIRSVGGEKISPIFTLSSEEMVEDKYGFARAFTLCLSNETDVKKAIATLQESPLIEEVTPVTLSETFR